MRRRLVHGAVNESAIHVDVALVGGGVASLWLACLARNRGLSVVVIAPEPLGGEQTMASQGIIHGGAKYSLHGRAKKAAPDHLAAMPSRWRRCLAGNAVGGSGDIDLSGVGVLAEHVELRACTRRAQLRKRAALRLLAGAPNTPVQSGGTRLPDFVVDVDGLIARLVRGIEGCVLPAKVDPEKVRLGDKGVAGIDLAATTVTAERYVFAAGAGNADLAPRLGFGADATMLRALHQAWAVVEHSPPTFAHCLVRAFGTEPDVTVTTHDGGNKTILYLGGHLATTGVARSADDQVAAAKRTLASALPHVDLGSTQFGALHVARAEPRRSAASRVDDAFLATCGNALLCFPVKLSLAPRLGDLFLREVAGLKPVVPTRSDAPSGRSAPQGTRVAARTVVQQGQGAPLELARRPWA
ncbi:MAG: FAD-binding oxidoreductase [Gammaproteobacteria bacterium]|nr:FAD-binding oxidoreductase [Gammaproteobacteria bacterium]MYB38812.1 FAD-binding oxidoreductase [Gammaproteobacteria bacterium]